MRLAALMSLRCMHEQCAMKVCHAHKLLNRDPDSSEHPWMRCMRQLRSMACISHECCMHGCDEAALGCFRALSSRAGLAVLFHLSKG